MRCLGWHRPMRIALLFLAVATVGQSPPTFRSESRVVEITIVATRAGDHPVNDLRADELTVLDNGARQTIGSFEKLGARATGGVRTAASLPNPVPPRPPQPRLSVIVLDALNTYWADQIYGREGVSQMLAKLPPGDSIAIFALGETLHQLHRISTIPRSARRSTCMRENNPKRGFETTRA